MAIFVDANARKLMAFAGYWVDIRVQYTNTTRELVLIRPSQAVFELLDSAGRSVQRRSPEMVLGAVQVPPGEYFRFEFSVTTEADLRGATHSLRTVIGDESAYISVQIQAAAMAELLS